MKFKIDQNERIKNYQLLYKLKEFNFDIDSQDHESFKSLLVNDLNIEIDENRKLMYTWCYCSLINTTIINFAPKDYSISCLYAELEESPPAWHILSNKQK